MSRSDEKALLRLMTLRLKGTVLSNPLRAGTNGTIEWQKMTFFFGRRGGAHISLQSLTGGTPQSVLLHLKALTRKVQWQGGGREEGALTTHICKHKPSTSRGRDTPNIAATS